MPISDRFGAVALGLALALGAGSDAARAEAPARVVSINLCTDQLAMMLAAPGQLVSVSHIARDTRASAMAEEAQAYPINHGLAEEVFLLAPDLVVAGTFTSAATVDMLERLGIPVARFAPARDMESIRAAMARMGALLGQETAADATLAAFERDLARLSPPAPDAPRAALYYANGYTLGPGTLAHEILSRAGLANIAEEIGMGGGGTLPLERLVTEAPDLVITGQRYPAASRSEEILDHPALADLGTGGAVPLSDGDWVCGTPHVLGAIEMLAAARPDPAAGGS